MAEHTTQRMGNNVWLEEGKTIGHLPEFIKDTVEEALNAMQSAGAAAMCNA